MGASARREGSLGSSVFHCSWETWGPGLCSRGPLTLSCVAGGKTLPLFGACLLIYEMR